MTFITILLQSLSMAFKMFWEVLWPLILGFFLSAVVQTFVSHKAMAKILGKDSIKSVSISSLFGIASSSCSYAAVALTRSIFVKGASFTNSMIFEIASTNLVIELGLILLFTMGWQFALAEWVGGILMIIFLTSIFKLTLSKQIITRAKNQAERGVQGKMEGHAAMDMSIQGKGTVVSKLFNPEAFTAISHFFIMDIVAIWTDLVLGFLIAGILTVAVPKEFWQTVFISENQTVNFLLGPIIGPIIAIISFVCSVGNIPLAAVLWNGGISFGGVISFIFADLIILPILNIYRKYYGVKTAIYILITFFITMTLAGYIIEILFSILHFIPHDRHVFILESSIAWNYTTFLNVGFLLLAAIFTWRFFTTGGKMMLSMMDKNQHTHMQ